MREKTKCTRWFHYTIEDAKAAQAELDQRAEQGWELEEVGLFTATFRRAEHPRPCWVEPARWQSVRRKDEDARADYLALCDEAGWELISEDGGLFYFRAREGTDPAPIQTDAGVEWEDVWKKALRGQLSSMLRVVIYGVVWNGAQFLQDRPRVWELFLSDAALAAQTLLIFLLAAFMAFPLYYTVIQSLKPIEEIFRFPPTLYVSRPVMDNYGEMFRILANMWVPLSRYLFNTLFIAVLGTGLHVLVAGMAAYPLAKHNFPGRNLIFGVIMLGLLFVNQVTFVPSFVIIAKLGILNTYLAYLLPTIGVSLGLFLMRQFISQLPDSMLEAAKIDGANEHRVFFSIVFPSIKPAVITVIIFQFINLWNGLPSDVVYNEEFKSLTQAMSQITAANAYARYGPSMAASVIMMIPPIVIFVSLQSKVIETMTSAGIKG